jgi:hypothetical protein
MGEFDDHVTFSSMSAKVLALNPECEPTPGEGFFTSRTNSAIGVVLKGHAEGEETRISFADYLSNAHESLSQ